MTKKKIKILYMGDSITFGQYLDPNLRWSSLIDIKIRNEFKNLNIEFQTKNCGVSGETTRMGLERFPKDVQDFSPDIMTLQFGLNDCNCWESDKGLPRVSLNAYRANLLEMIERSQKFGCRKIILSTNHVTLRRDQLVSLETYESARIRYNNVVREAAKESDIELCDIEQRFNEFSDLDLQKSLLPYPDILHLSEFGNQVYANYIWPYIQKSIKQLVVVPTDSN